MNAVVFTLCNKSNTLHCGNDGNCDGVLVPSVWNYFKKLFHVPYLWNLFAGGLTTGLLILCGIGYLEHTAPHGCMILCGIGYLEHTAPHGCMIQCFCCK